jgi:hypothetical protein
MFGQILVMLAKIDAKPLCLNCANSRSNCLNVIDARRRRVFDPFRQNRRLRFKAKVKDTRKPHFGRGGLPFRPTGLRARPCGVNEKSPPQFGQTPIAVNDTNAVPRADWICGDTPAI